MGKRVVYVVIDVNDDESGSVFSVHETRESAKKQIEKFSWRSSTYRIEEHEVKS